MQKARPGTPDDIQDRKAAALTKAALESARRLGLSPVDTAALFGVQQGALAAMKAGKRSVDGTSGEAECADALVRITKRLQVILGDTDTAWRSWIRRESEDLKGKPLDTMLQRYGALKVATYLEGRDSL